MELLLGEAVPDRGKPVSLRVNGGLSVPAGTVPFPDGVG